MPPWQSSQHSLKTAPHQAQLTSSRPHKTQDLESRRNLSKLSAMSQTWDVDKKRSKD